MRHLHTIIFCIACQAWGAGEASALNGAWIGTIGNHKVIACFELASEAGKASHAQYFYLRRMKPIALLPDEHEQGRWLEGMATEPTGIWTIDADRDAIRGTWSSPTRTSRLPIALARFRDISGNFYGEDCPLQFVDMPIAPPRSPIKIIRGNARKNHGQHFRSLSVLDGAVSSLALAGKGHGTTRINTLLENTLWGNVVNYLTCPTPGGGKPDYMSNVELSYRDEEWVSFIASTSGYCGGAHPFSGFVFSTWSVTTGREVNLWTWIRDSRKPGADPQFDGFSFSINYAAPPELNKIITNQAVRQRLAFDPDDAAHAEGCIDAIRANDGYQIRLGTAGLVFNPSFPHVAQACDDDIQIPYAQTLPFLTGEGHSAVSRLMKRSN